ncbi:MAG: hypothetical protein ABI914_04895 [Acidobacteriota bacterium]
MKYMERGGFESHELMRWTLGLTCVLLAGFWWTNAILFVSRLGLTPASIAAYYRGSDADFRAPRTAGAMLEVTHGHLPMMALVLLLLTHLLIFAPWSRRAKITMIAISFLSALVEEGSSWLVRFVDPRFAWLKLASFLTLQGALAFLLAGLLLFLRSGARGRQADDPGLRARRRAARRRSSRPHGTDGGPER